MMTRKNISAQQALDYFLQGYYLEGTSQWLGQNAQKLGLQGPVTNKKVFSNIINGFSPDGKKELCSRKVEAEARRAALDCTFSCPKSVSITALIGGDKRLITIAQQRAVEKVFALIERHCALTRVMVNGESQVINTGKLLAAAFNHIESRDLDPHVHTHLLIMNMVEGPNGKWYSHLNDQIVKNRKHWGMVYQHYLALEVQRLGYEIEWRGHGQFEIKGYTQEELMDFSKRRQEILAVAGPNSSWLEREKAWEITRKRKETINPEELKARWREEAEALGLKIVQPKEPQPDLQPATIDEQLLRDAIEHCSTWEVAFSLKDLGNFILKVGETYDIAQLEQSLSETFGISLNRTYDAADLEELIQKKAELIPLPEPDRLRFTTYAALERERKTIELMQQGQGTVEAIADAEAVQNYLNGTILNEGQRQAVKLATSTTDKYILWQGGAGTGKTETLKVLKTILEDNGNTVRGFSNGSEAVKELRQKGGIESDTVAGLLHSKPPEEIVPNQYWIVDEGGQIGALDAYRLMQRAEQEKARVLFVGDVKQFSAVAAGNPFKSFQEEGIATAQILESVRQKNPELKLAVDLIARGQVEQGFAQLSKGGKILEGESVWQAEQIVADYMQASKQKQSILVLVGTHKERLELTQAIRDEQKLEGTLGESAFVTQLDAKDKLSLTEKRYIQHFQKGDIIIPLRDYKRRQLEKGATYEVIGKTKTHLSLRATDGTLSEVDTGFDKEIYTPNQIDIAVGDRLKWTKTDRKQGKSNGQEFVVTAIEGNKAQILYVKEDKTETIDLSKAQHLDYAIVSTTYSAQGKDADIALISADFTVSKEGFYVAVSRVKHDLKLYTENQNSLLKLAQQSKANEIALDLVRKIAKKQIKVEPVAKPAVAPIKQPKEHQAQHAVVPPVKRLKKSQAQQTASFVKEHPAPKPELPIPPDWLAAGKRVYCQDQGWAEVQSVSANKLTLKLDDGKNHHLLGWAEAVAQQLIIPEPAQPFWEPSRAEEPPTHIDHSHWQELVEGSIIHPAIAAQNFKSLQYDMVEQAHEAWEYLFYSDKLERSNTGRLTAGILKRFAHIEAGGWWCNAGVDPRRAFKDLQPGQCPPEKLWGCLKPNNPREDSEKPGKKIKYEHPLKTELSIFLLAIPNEIADRIYEKAKVSPPESDRASGFWYCVWKHNVPITITEGAKKAGSLLSQGHATIGLPGIYAGYRSKDDQGDEIKARLHDELAVFATPGREISICFDFETKPKTKRNIDIAISRTGSLLEKQGAKVNVISLPGPDKGVDDFIKAQGPLAYERLGIEALPLKSWRERNKQQQQSAPVPTQVFTLKERRERLKLKLANKLLTKEQAANTPKPTLAIIPQSSFPSSSLTPSGQTTELKLTQEQEAFHDRIETQQSRTVDARDVKSNLARDRGLEDQSPELATGSGGNQDHSEQLAADIGGDQVQHYQFAIGAGQLYEATVRGTDLEETERYAGRYAEFDRVPEQSQHGLGGSTEFTAENAAIYGFRERVKTGLESKTAPAAERGGEWQPQTARISNRDETESQQHTTERILDTIVEYIELSAIESDQVIQELETLRENLAKLQSFDWVAAIQQFDAAISNDNIGQSSAENHDLTFLAGREVSIQPYQFSTSVEDLAQAISEEAEQEAFQQLSGALAELDQRLKTIQLPMTSIESLKAGVEEFSARVVIGLEEQTTRGLLTTIVDYVEQTAVEESASIAQALKELTNRLDQFQTSQLDQVVTALNSGVSQGLEQIRVSPVEPPSPEEIRQQLIEAIAEHVEHAALESEPLTQTLESLTERLRQFQLTNITKVVEQFDKTLSDYLREDTSPVIQPTPSGESISPTQPKTEQNAVKPYQFAIRAEELAQAISEVAEQEALQQLADPVIKLTRTLTNQQFSTVEIDSLQSAVEQIQAIVQPETEQTPSAQCLNAIANYLEQEALDSEEVIQAVTALTENLARFKADETIKAVEELNTVIAQYLPQSAVPAPGLNQETCRQLAAAIADYLEYSALESEEVTVALEQLNSNLSQLRTVNTIQAIEQFNTAISDYKKMDIPGLDRSMVGGKWVRNDKLSQEQFDQLFDIRQETRHEQLNSQQLQPTDSADIGRSVSEQLESISNTARPHRSLGEQSAVEQPVRSDEPADASPTTGLSALGSIAHRVEQPGGPHRTAGATSQQPGAEIGHPAADRTQSDRRVSELIANNSRLERSNQQLKKPAINQIESTPATDRAMAPTTKSAVRKPQPVTRPATGQTRPRVRANVERCEQTSRRTSSTRQSLASLTQQLREIPLAELAPHLGLEPDRRDKRKWRGEGQIISINGQKFYDHLSQKGGHGAIDLVMQVKQQNFKEAVDWLSKRSSSISPTVSTERSQPQRTAEVRRTLFQPPTPNESKWLEVRQYLVDKRGLPAQIIDDLHRDGKLYAASVDQGVLVKLRSKGYAHPERITNAVFIRSTDTGEITGASLRGVAEDSHFKGLATGSRKEQGWFTFSQGQGPLERILLTESPIDAMSAAAIAKSKSGTTMFIATDGTGAAPIDLLRQHQAAGVQIVVAQDADRAGEEMAWKIGSCISKVWEKQQSHAKTRILKLNLLVVQQYYQSDCVPTSS